MFTAKKAVLAVSALTFISGQAYAEDVDQMSDVEVIGITPVLGVGLPEDKIPYNVQSASAADFEKSTSLDITDFMNRNFSSVIVNDAQNNPLQPDIQYRGFTASPLLGLPQGLAVYQNGVRVNEVFGDTINWDLIPESSIANMNLVGGANPVFGLNTLGGAISIETKNGFNYQGNSVEAYGGYPQERVVVTAESGGNNGRFGYYGTIQYFDEEGWRDASPSDSINFFGALSYRDQGKTSLDLNFNYADTNLIGNGAIPIELANQDYEAIFTSPDQTENEMFFVQAQGDHWLSNLWQVAGNAYYRSSETTSFNGDGTEYEDCGPNGGTAGELCEEDDDESILDQFGNPIATLNADGSERNGLQNRSLRDQESYGINLQSVFIGDLFGKPNQLIIGTAYNYGEVVFDSSSEVGSLTAARSTTGTGFFVPEEGTAVDSETYSVSLFFTDTLSATDKLDLTVSGRFNHTDIELNDLGGSGSFPLTDAAPALTGEHEFNRFNPAVGATYAFQPGLSGYLSYSESARAPTAVELACAEPTAPCNLPNGFLADPPLEQVVARSVEGGFRGNIPRLGMMQNIGYRIGGFFTVNEDDIIFQNTGGVSGNEGFFDNIGDTERLGMELALNGQVQKFDWFLNYSYVRATFETSFQSSSANNPFADANELIQVQAGDYIPGIPEHTVKFGGDYAINKQFSVGGDVLYKSGVYVRGDESNQLGRLDGYGTINLRGSYQVNETFKVFARVNNLLDTEYESFGLLGEPDEVPGFGGFTDSRFVGVGQPLSGFVGVSATF